MDGLKPVSAPDPGPPPAEQAPRLLRRHVAGGLAGGPVPASPPLTREDLRVMASPERTAAWGRARRLLAVRLDKLGDVLMTTPALRALRQSAPNTHLTLLTSPAGAALAPFLPEVDQVITATCPWLPGSPGEAEALLALARQLRKRSFDGAVIFTVYSQSALPAALLCWLAGIPLRLAHSRENPYHLLSDWIPDPEPHETLRHEVRRQLDLVAFVGAHTEETRLSFRVRPRDRARAAALLREAGIDPSRPYAVVHPGASAASRRYPPELFATALRRLATLSGPRAPQLVFTGEAEEIPLVEAVRQHSRPAASLAGRLSLGELGAVLERAVLLIANNSGPVHLAAALGVAVVDLYALTNPQHAPWKTPCRVLYQDVPCRYCYRSTCPQGHHACLRLLDPERIAAAARELLDLGAERATPPPLQAPHRRG